MSEEKDKQLTIPQIYAKGAENLKEKGVSGYLAGGKMGPAVKANRKYLDSLFFEPRFFDPVDVDTSLTLLGRKLAAPVFCSAISKTPYMSETGIVEIARGIASAGSSIMLGIGGSADLQNVIDTGAPVIKIVKPYRNTDLIYEKVRDAESRGCAAVGMDVDHFYGAWIQDRTMMGDLFCPQQTDELKQLISQTRLPFVVKGVLSVSDAQKAVELGASAIVVSNHGSASFDYSVPSMIALPKVAASVGDRLTVMVDTGFQSGSDVFKALAAGANAVGFASPLVLAWAANGSKGVELLLNQIRLELRRNMAGAGCPDLPSMKRAIVIHVPASRE